MSITSDKVLIVAQDASLRFSLRKTLEVFQFDWGEASNGEGALTRLRMVDYEAVLLDFSTPGLSGIATCRQVRSAHPRLPVLVLSDCDCLDNKVAALEAGADDYVIKPFSVRELIARLRSAIRRFRAPVAGIIERFVVGEIVLDFARRRVEKSGIEIALTPIEFRTLHMLMAQAGIPISHGDLLTALWEQESSAHREHLRVVISALRKKIEDNPSHPTYLITHNHFGYCFRDQ
jgi:two-component system KDP operon response regulator KdpE